MKTILAGSRTVTDPKILEQAIQDSGFTITEVVCGCAKGADELGRLWAVAHGIPVAKFPADWKRHGNVAGFVRNTEMANYSEALIALWNGHSAGTAMMIRIATAKGLKIHIHRV